MSAVAVPLSLIHTIRKSILMILERRVKYTFPPVGVMGERVEMAAMVRAVDMVHMAGMPPNTAWEQMDSMDVTVEMLDKGLLEATVGKGARSHS